MDKYDEMISCVKGQGSFVDAYIKGVHEMRREENEWVEELRSKGFKACHPNDGWVDRVNNKLYFAYPQFNDGAKVGDLVMLGWHFKKESQKAIRLVKEEEGLLKYFYFEYVDFSQQP